ncbi:MAG: 1-(5-phosphoribosyl)-5-[(5-phosphoribosylamino)methylideneamino]imidazole-4-carboxamide isomerase [Cyclobacteriaceae bacterium]
MYLIPAIDIIDGKCVRLTKGDYNQKTKYNDNPLEVAKQFEDAGIKRLHLVDLDGEKQKTIVNRNVLESITSNTSLVVDFGGGIQSNEDIKIAFESGATQVTGGSIAIKNEVLFTEWIETYGNEKIILGADAKDGNIAVGGWQETTEAPLMDFIDKYTQKGIQYTISTDVAKDGMMQGPSVQMYKDMQEQFPELNIIASGGVSCMDDLYELQELNLYGVVIGKAFYEGKISLKDFQEFNSKFN